MKTNSREKYLKAINHLKTLERKKEKDFCILSIEE